MILLIAGSRGLKGGYIFKLLSQTVRNSGFKPTKIISGGAKGIDTLARTYANLWGIPFEEYPAEWDKYGKAAGMIRNKVMVDLADAAVILWDTKSRGTKSTITLCKKKGIPYKVEEIIVARPVKGLNAKESRA